MKKEILDAEQKSRVCCLAEEKLKQQMEEVVEPFLMEISLCGKLKAEKKAESKTVVGKRAEEAEGITCEAAAATGEADNGQEELYYELYPQKTQKGTIVISYGFTESCLKYHELIYYFYQQGYQVAVMDHRGHGKSLREVEDVTIVHIDLFSRYVKDLHQFVKNVVKPMAQGQPLYLYAHSMGGCIGAFYLEQYPKDFAKAILNAPMLGLKLGACPAWAARILCDLKVMKGSGTERLFTQSTFDPEESFAQSSASSEARHAWYLEHRQKDPTYQTCSASYYWGKEAINAGEFVISRTQAKKVQIPVLLFQAELDDLVKPRAQQKFVERIGNGRLMLVKGVRHEIYRAPNAVLEAYLEEIFRFYEEDESSPV